MKYVSCYFSPRCFGYFVMYYRFPMVVGSDGLCNMCMCWSFLWSGCLYWANILLPLPLRCTFLSLNVRCGFFCRASFLKELGTTIRVPFSSSPFTTEISSWTGMYGAIEGGTSLFSGQIDVAYFISICNVESFLVSSLYMSSFWSLIGYCLRIIWIYLSISVSDISCLSSVRYARDSVSAITDSRPGIYITSNSYFCRASKNLCILGGLFVIDFFENLP